MNADDQQLARAVRGAMPADAETPSFAHTLEAAAQRAGRHRHRVHLLAAASVAAVAIVVVLVKLPVPPKHEYIEITELLQSTSWTAPSDALLPESQFDIYQDLPTLMESTDGNAGALL